MNEPQQPEVPADSPAWAQVLAYRVGQLEIRLASTRRTWATVATIIGGAMATGMVELLTGLHNK